MIDVKEAVNKARTHLIDLLGAGVDDLRLEEVELAHRGERVDDKPEELRPEEGDVWDKSYWLITLSFLPSAPNPIIQQQRLYKVFKIEAETGDFVAMKMRKVA